MLRESRPTRQAYRSSRWRWWAGCGSRAGVDLHRAIADGQGHDSGEYFHILVTCSGRSACFWPGGWSYRETPQAAANSRPDAAAAGYCRSAGLPIGSPAYSCMASRLSRAGYLAAAGPSANARSRFVVTCLTKAGVRAADAVRRVAVDRLHPAHGARVEHPGAAGDRVVGRVAEAGPPWQTSGECDKHLDRPRHRVAGVDPVVLDADQVGEAGTLPHPGPGEQPAVRGGHRVGRGRRVALVEGADQRGLRVGTGGSRQSLVTSALSFPYSGHRCSWSCSR